MVAKAVFKYITNQVAEKLRGDLRRIQGVTTSDARNFYVRSDLILELKEVYYRQLEPPSRGDPLWIFYEELGEAPGNPETIHMHSLMVHVGKIDQLDEQIKLRLKAALSGYKINV